MIHTGYTGAGAENYEWYEHCPPPDPNPKLPAAMKAAQQANWQACNEAAIKHNAAIPVDDPTPEWVKEAATKKSLADLNELEANTKQSYTPGITAIEIAIAEQAKAEAQDQIQQASAGLNQKMIIGAVVVGIIGLLVATRPRKD